jgi:hypothetical protein
MGVNELSALLWRERAALEALLEAPESAVEAARAEMQAIVLLRDIEVATVGEEWGVNDADHAALCVHAPPGPWGWILTEHLTALDACRSELSARAARRSHRSGRG